MHRLNLFTKLMRLRKWDEACTLAQKAADNRPTDSLWPLLCSQACSAAGKHQEALFFAGRAQDLEKQFPALKKTDLAAMWHAAGLAAFLNKAFDPAFAALKNAHELEPEHTGIMLYFALAAHQARHYTDAIRLYRRLLELQPQNNQARFNLFLCLQGDSPAKEIEAFVSSWPENDRASLEYRLAAASLLLLKKEYQAALERLNAIEEAAFPEISPEYASQALVLRGRCLRALGETCRATLEFSRALELAPSSVEAVNELWMTLQTDENGPEAASIVLEEFMKENGKDPLLEAKQAFSIPSVLHSAEQADAIRRRVRDFLLHGENFPMLGRPLEVMDSPPFHLAFHNKNDKDLLREITGFLSRHTTIEPETLRAAAEREPLDHRLKALPPARNRKIGFISRHFTNHTIMSYFFRLLRELCPRLSHCFILEFPQADNPFRRELAEKARLITLPEKLEQARQGIRELDLDILIYLDLGMDPLTWFLAFSRLAKVQCALYGHPMTTGIPAVDFFLSPRVMEPANAENHYSERLQTFPGLLCAPIALPVPLPPAGSKKTKESVYLCAQSLFKVHPDMDGVVRQILSQDPDARMHFFQSRLRHETIALQNRMRQTLPECHDRICWLPQCSEQEFLELLLNADVIVDTPYFSGGSTSFKALGIGAPVVTMEGDFMRGRQTAGLYRHMGIDGLTAETLEGLGDLALRTAHSPGLRELKRQEIFEVKDRLFSLESADHLESFLLSL